MTDLRFRIEKDTPEVISPFSRHVLVYYVPGNPGLIEYYDVYLAMLRAHLNQKTDTNEYSKHKTQYHIVGANLLGFDWTSSARETSRQTTGKSGPYSLNDIKWHLIRSIQQEVAALAEMHSFDASQISVILIGHSIGTWLILETLEWAQNARLGQSQVSISPAPSGRIIPNISGGILLFPTVVDISKSPNGLQLGWILAPRWSASIIAFIARVLFFFIPLSILIIIMQVFARMPQNAACITAKWLKTNRIVHQALHMAHYELNEVNEDTWSDQTWSMKFNDIAANDSEAIGKKAKEVVNNDEGRTQLFFYWGICDNWVANVTRDKLIAERARTGSFQNDRRPVMEVDKHNLPHAFSLTNQGSMYVAMKTADWIREVMDDLPPR